MSIPHSNSDISGAVEPTLYLLEMDSTFNLRPSDAQVIPLHILNNGTDISHNRFFLPIQNKERASQEQLEVLMDACQEPGVKYVAVQVENSYLRGQQQSVCQTHQLSSPLHSVSSKQLSDLGDEIETSGTNVIPPLINSSKQTLDVAYKKGMQNYVHIPDRSIVPRAIAVLPTILQIRQKDIISPRRTLLPRTRFGPIQGVKQKMSLEEANEVLQTAVTNKRPLFILKDDDDHIVYINVTDKDKANWIGLLPLGDDNSANVWIYEENNELYIIATEPVPSRKQLMLGYSKKYAQEYGLIGPTKDIETGFPLSSKTWWCYECQRAMSSASQLQRHMNTFHQDDKAVTRRRRYRCRHCARTFSRIFTLRRHMARHCEKKPIKSENVISTETLPESILNTSLNSEDNRVPSDESFQNYSNSLDFSTNLFDTDRMPSLDISGNSRSEVFNPYGLDNIGTLTNDLEYANGSPNKIEVSPTTDNEKIHQEKKTETSLSCTYCKQNIARGKKRQHISECSARRFECDCKKIFSSKELLALHIYSEHSINKETEEEDQNEDDTTSTTVENNKTYVCEQCQHAFKRRGMLVNHLWRVHNTVSARVPLVRRVRHFPCGCCPKVYRTAAKRARHVSVHHPGAENIRAKEIEGGTRACSPAACPECPRQYATRAKLLQHQRQHHPYLVPTPPKKSDLTEKGTKASQLAEAREVKFTQTLNEPLTIGSHIVCTGTPTDDLPWFAVNIGCGEPDSGRADIAVHFNVRLPQCYVVRNTRRHGKWGHEETTAFRLFPFKAGRPFTIEIVVDETETLWALDGDQYCSYTHRNPSPFVAEWVQVTGIRDATLKIQKTDNFPVLSPTPLEVPVRANVDGLKESTEPTWRPNIIALLTNGIPEGHQLVIYGRLRPLLHSFVVDLMDTAREWPRPNILAHINVRAYDESQRERQLVVLNTRLGEWGLERRQRTARLVPGTYTKLRILRGTREWAVYSDNMLIGELEHRAAAEGVRALRIRGDLYPEEIYLCPVSSSPV